MIDLCKLCLHFFVFVIKKLKIILWLDYKNLCYRSIKTDQEILGIDIQLGWKKGTKITFKENGSQEHGVISTDLFFVIVEKSHKVFKMDGK